MAAKAAKLTGQNERGIFETLLQREKLGSTGIGHGVAIPHGKLAKLERLFGLFARLDRPVDFEDTTKIFVGLLVVFGFSRSSGELE